MKDIIAVFPGILKTVEEINEAVVNLTGDDEPCFDINSDDWKSWVEWKDGKTYIVCDGE